MATSNELSMGAVALAYAARGIPVVPLHTPRMLADGTVGCSCSRRLCHDQGKHPRTRHGLHDATTDPDRIRSWWRRWPEANIGARTGVVFDVVDIDGRDAATRLRDRLLADGWAHWPPGPVVATGKGWHLLVAPTGHGNRPPRGLPGVDWRGRGGYVVLPPSLHPSGKPYRWLRDLDIQMPDAPATLRALLAPATPEAPGSANYLPPGGAAAGTAAPVRVLVTGDRHWTDAATIRAHLQQLPAGSVIVHGDAPGADRIAAREAARLGLQVEAHTADWDRDGRAAGPRRNARMLASGISLVLAFHNDLAASKGTKDTITRARAANIPVKLQRSSTAAAARSQAWAQGALRAEAAAVATARQPDERRDIKGERAATLNRAAFKLGQLTTGPSPLLDAETVRRALTEAAARCGLPASEAARVIACGLAAGRRHPREAPR